eukprot:1157908-Pelagomonas_calceolata.AAC.8
MLAHGKVLACHAAHAPQCFCLAAAPDHTEIACVWWRVGPPHRLPGGERGKEGRSGAQALVSKAAGPAWTRPVLCT